MWFAHSTAEVGSVSCRQLPDWLEFPNRRFRAYSKRPKDTPFSSSWTNLDSSRNLLDMTHLLDFVIFCSFPGVEHLHRAIGPSSLSNRGDSYTCPRKTFRCGFPHKLWVMSPWNDVRLAPLDKEPPCRTVWLLCSLACLCGIHDDPARWVLQQGDLSAKCQSARKAGATDSALCDDHTCHILP